jgi:5-hydroxyisourate hydrolase-like protein (transthyretin family)
VKVRVASVLVVIALAGFATAETLQGTVTNGTTGKPAGGVEVTLLSLAQGMTETAHTKTDSSGRYKLDFTDAGMPHLVRVTHQEVNYFKMAPPGVSSADVQVYEAAKKLEAIQSVVDVMRLQSEGNGLQVIEVYAVQNTSKPPRTQIGEHSYEIALPSGAVIDEAAARSPGGQPISAMPDAVAGEKDRYAFNFPLRPGETQFQVSYHLPYNGSQTTVKATLLHNVQHFVAMLPRSMQFSATGAQFAPLEQEKTVNVQVASNARSGDQIAMTISGTGVLSEDNGGQGEQTAHAGSGMSSRPGGGLGTPIDSPDPLSHYRWPLLGGLAVVLVAGGFYVVTRRPAPAFEAAAVGTAQSLAEDVPTPKAKTALSSSGSSALLDAMKEELFQLEVDRQQGRISETEYKTAKAALDLTLQRAIARTRK